VLPTGLSPMLATAGALPHGDAWAYEVKWDGYRVLAYVEHSALTLRSRTGRDVTADYPEIALDLPDCVVDGELVALLDGTPDFSALQQHSVAVSFLPFDLLHLLDEPLLRAPYAKRRALLTRLLPDAPAAFDDGKALLETTKQQGLEGVVAKRRDSLYLPGRRTDAWIKAKHVRRQSALVGGWKAGAGGRTNSIGSLLLGLPAEEGLVFIGHVGTGFTDRTLTQLKDLLNPLTRPTSPFAIPPKEPSTWVEPVVIVDVEFTAWTPDGKLRHPSYKGIRTDLDPSGLVRE
jgi:bifunctional non-homologous end joining protein LigD